MTVSSDTHPEKMDTNLFVLAVASLFEKEFSIDWLLSLGDMKASQVLLVLEKGIDKGLIKKKKAGVYSFANPKARFGIESPFTKEEKENLHRKIAKILASEIIDENEMTRAVASQLLNVMNDEKGCLHLLRAGSLFRKSFQPDKALTIYEKIFMDMGPKDSQKADELFIDAAIGYSKITASTHEADSVLDALKRASLKASNRRDKSRQAILEMHIAKNQWLKNRYKVAFNHYEKGQRLALEINDPFLNRAVNSFKTFFPYWHGKYTEAIQNYEKLAPEVNQYPDGRFPLLVESAIGPCYAIIGQVGQSLGMLKSLLNHCQQIGDDYIADITRQGLGWVFLEIGQPQEALKYLEEAGQQKGPFQGVLHEFGQFHALTIAYYLTGQIDKSNAILQELIRQRNKKSGEIISWPGLLEISRLVELGKYPSVEGLMWEKEIRLGMESGNLWVKGAAYRHMAQLKEVRGREDKEIFHFLQESIKHLTKSGHQIELARTRLEIGRQFLRIGQESDAKQEVLNAAEILNPINPALIPDDLRHMVTDFRQEENLLEEILRMGKEIVTIRSTKTLARKIIATANRITGAERGAIFLIEEASATPKVILRAAMNLQQGDIEDRQFGKAMSMINKVIQKRSGSILKITDPNEGVTPAVNTIRSCICVPLKLRDEVIGVLYHDNCYLPSAFRESDLEILDYFAAWAAIAMDNARAYAEVQEMNRVLKEEKQYIEEQHLETFHYDDIIGESPAFLESLKLVDQVASSESTVLILGETGSGKEVLARAIHRQSNRADKSFIRVNCAALSESIITSELFGHEKGAFTGARERRLGRFELANGGTLFLDEIGEVPLDVQVRLLRVLQNGEFERVGGRKTLHSDFRLIAATNRDLDHEVSIGRFRQDLFYRLNVFPIYSPPLRNRPEDIPLLAKHFLSLFSAKSTKQIPFIPEEELEKLLRYDWPGNVRELENVIERGLLLSHGRYFKVPELIPPNIKRPDKEPILSLEENERQMILRALKKTSGKIGGKGGAAELLKIHRNTLQSRMKKLRIKRKTSSLYEKT